MAYSATSFIIDGTVVIPTKDSKTIKISNYEDYYYTTVTSTSYIYETDPIKIVYPANCKNCGAVLKTNICEYCGSDNGEYKRY